MSRFTPLRIFLATALTATLALVMQPTTPAAAVDIYTTPGIHFVNGREWSTTCGKYSSTVERCRTEIKATQVTFEGGRYVQKTGFVFNNLTYLPAPRKAYKGNPIGEEGTWTTADGRRWKTECDNATTGRNGCRSYIFGTTIGVVKENPRTYGQINQWMFNNIVQFSPPPPPPPAEPCSNLPIPAGFKVSVVNGKKIPHATKTPYEPNTLYNPTSISQFIRNVTRNTTLKNTDREKWDCLIDIGTTALMDGSTTDTFDGKTVRWFPYMFEFDASGTPDKIPPLAPGWHSGMAQGTGLGVMAELATATGDNKWLRVGDEVLNSFRVPFDATDEKGGFTNRGEDGTDVPWFEMYPTNPPTSVLNGQLEALLGLDLWARDGRGADPQFARDLFNEAVPALEGVLPNYEVEVQGGTLTSYDAVRGYAADALRLTTSQRDFRVTGAQLNGVEVPLPVTTPTSSTLGSMLSPVLNVREKGEKVGEWRSISAPSNKVTANATTGTVTIRSDKNAWQGIQQIVPLDISHAKKPMTMTLEAKLSLQDGPGLSGRVAVYQQCARGGTSLLFETQKPRGREWTEYTMGFNAPPLGCDLLVQLLHSSYGLEGTTVQYRNIELNLADPVDEEKALFPHDHEINDLNIFDAPTLPLTLTGRGRATLEVYSDGKWRNLEEVNLIPGTPIKIDVPERYTGRNLHYGYHENNVGLLGSLYQRAHQAGLSQSHEVEFLRAYAVKWERMAPSRHGTVPPPRVDARARMMQQGPDLDSYELPLVDPFQLLMEE